MGYCQHGGLGLCTSAIALLVLVGGVAAQPILDNKNPTSDISVPDPILVTPSAVFADPSSTEAELGISAPTGLSVDFLESIRKNVHALPGTTQAPHQSDDVVLEQPSVDGATNALTVAKPTPTPTPAATTSPAPAPSAQAAAAVQPAAAVSKDVVLTRLQGWRSAWEAKNPERYLEFYSKSYQPLNLSRAQWESQRRAKLQKRGAISVEFSDVEMVSTSSGVETRFLQRYSSDDYSDVNRKSILWVEEAGDWRIATETQLSK